MEEIAAADVMRSPSTPSMQMPGLSSSLMSTRKETLMMIVDTHCHALPHWFEPVETLLHQMNANGVEKATLVKSVTV
jgi:hypothetical protein